MTGGGEEEGGWFDPSESSCDLLPRASVARRRKEWRWWGTEWDQLGYVASILYFVGAVVW